MALYPHGLYNYTTDVQLTILSISFPSSSCNNLFNFLFCTLLGYSLCLALHLGTFIFCIDVPLGNHSAHSHSVLINQVG